MVLLNIEHLKKSFGAEEVLQDIHFDVKEKERIGMIGHNGAGKTTVFKVICGQEPPTEGIIHKAKGLSIGYLEQIPEGYGTKQVLEVLSGAFADLFQIQQDMRQLEKDMSEADESALETLMHAYSESQKLYEINGGYEIDEKIGRIATGLKLEAFLTQPFETLSGGEKTRVLLGRLLLEAPDLLLLDEPTNHLDVESVEWLESFLKEYKGSVLIVSHDRYFLDRVVTRIVEIERKVSKVWHGNYTSYMHQKDEWLQQQMKAYMNQQKKIRAMEEAVVRFRVWGTSADNEAMFVKARNMERRIERLDKIDRPIEDTRQMKLAFDPGSRSGNDVLILKDVADGYDQTLLYQNIDLHMRYQERIALVGRNGVGKSTLFKNILSTKPPQKGEIAIGARIKTGYLAQEITFEGANRTVLEFFNAETGYNEGECRRKLARFMFVGEDVFKLVQTLSGGEKVRLKLCLLMEQGVNFLVMDEPTNHVDIPSREMLELALASFSGTILFISHDRYLIDKIATRIVELKEDNLTSYDGPYEAYRNKKELAEKMAEKKDASESPKKNYRDSDAKRQENAKKKRMKQLKDTEFALAEIESNIGLLEDALQTSGKPYEKLVKDFDELETMKKEYDDLMALWMQLQEEFDGSL